MGQVAIRLKRLGTKKRPHSRIVVIDHRKSRDGRALEEIGFYDPSQEPPFFKINVERANFWISKGAIPSPTVKQLLKKQSRS